MLSAGTNVEWLVEDLGVLSSAEESATLAATVDSTDGVVYVPALMGSGDAVLGLRGPRSVAGSHPGHDRRARDPGRARGHRQPWGRPGRGGTDRLGAAIDRLRVDGGMSTNDLFIQALADATGIPVEVSPVREATTVGAGFLAGMATGIWSGWDAISDTWAPRSIVEPLGEVDRDRWADAVKRASRWHEDLSALDF